MTQIKLHLRDVSLRRWMFDLTSRLDLIQNRLLNNMKLMISNNTPASTIWKYMVYQRKQRKT